MSAEDVSYTIDGRPVTARSKHNNPDASSIMRRRTKRKRGATEETEHPDSYVRGALAIHVGGTSIPVFIHPDDARA